MPSFIPTLEILRAKGPRPEEDEFRRGDANASGKMDITDGLTIFNFLFLGGRPPPCHEAADTDDDGSIVITDGVLILNVLFLGSGAIAAPGFESCGRDRTPTDPPFPACAYGACP